MMIRDAPDKWPKPRRFARAGCVAIRENILASQPCESGDVRRINMTIKLLFFGATAEIMRTHVREVYTTECTTAAAIVDEVIREQPDLARHKLLFAVNQEYVPDHVVLKGGDELAIFTAVSGG
ncbi:MAG: MoaD/ThiS family protein [Acidobacteria bacterium]|nr:MoaD/ThiS family protein [Acidobacteriota bacterium]